MSAVAVAVIERNAWRRYEQARRAFEAAKHALKHAEDELDRKKADLANAHFALDEEILGRPERV